MMGFFGNRESSRDTASREAKSGTAREATPRDTPRETASREPAPFTTADLAAAQARDRHDAPGRADRDGTAGAREPGGERAGMSREARDERPQARDLPGDPATGRHLRDDDAPMGRDLREDPAMKRDLPADRSIGREPRDAPMAREQPHRETRPDATQGHPGTSVPVQVSRDGGEPPPHGDTIAARPMPSASSASASAAMPSKEGTPAAHGALPGSTHAEHAAMAQPGTRAPAHGEDHLAPLFAHDAAQQLRTRWDAVQIGFVDDPARAVRDADELVAEVLRSLAQSFASQRAHIEGDGQGAGSTEQHRIALRRYRSFFQRLLSL